MIFEFSDYRFYLTNKLGVKGSRTGLRKKLSEHLNVHTTFISQVLNGKANMSLEQAEASNSFFLHTEAEAEFFIYLVMFERAGTHQLKTRFKEKIEKIKKENLNISKKLQPENQITDFHKQKFYSSWVYGAVHVLSSIEKYQNVDSMAKALHLSRSKTIEVIKFLADLNIIGIDDGKISTGTQHIHIKKNSELILQHHKNWRSHSINRMHFNSNEDLHYSACLSLSQDDAYKIKSLITDSIKKNIDIAIDSKEEEAFVYNIDFYSFNES